MRYYPIAAILGVSLAACQPANVPSGEAGASSAAPSSEVRAEPYDLRGEWGISRLDGQSLTHRIALIGSTGALRWEPGCALQHIFYRTAGSHLVFEKERFEEPRAVCDIGYPEDLPRVLSALEGRWTAEKQDNGDIALTNGSETITLEKLPVETVETLTGEWRVAGIDGESLGGPTGIALSADDNEIWWSPRCAGAIVPYKIVNERFMRIELPAVPPPPPGAAPVPPPLVCAVGLPPRLSDAMTAIRMANRIDRMPNGGVKLSGSDRSISLFPQ